ncbi:MAG: RNA ligase family protein [Deltaproteobacteria bacterium]|nr:RNA ligase family protein [Deltaproteobacteria bacterium]
MRLYAKIPHLPGSRVGPAERFAPAPLVARMVAEARDGDRVIVSEKLDGTCVAIVATDAGIEARGRDGAPCALSRNDGRRAFAAWVQARAARFAAVLAPGERLMIEWLALAHGTRYALPHGPAVAIDGFTDAVRWPLAETIARATAARLPIATVLHDGGALPVDEADARLGVHGHHGAIDAAEGVMYRLERGDEVVVLAKRVRPTKRDGIYLADHSGADHVWNSWHDEATP